LPNNQVQSRPSQACNKRFAFCYVPSSLSFFLLSTFAFLPCPTIIIVCKWWMKTSHALDFKFFFFNSRHQKRIIYPNMINYRKQGKCDERKRKLISWIHSCHETIMVCSHGEARRTRGYADAQDLGPAAALSVIDDATSAASGCSNLKRRKKKGSIAKYTSCFSFLPL